jgi:Tfp pilus assembly protein PilF
MRPVEPSGAAYEAFLQATRWASVRSVEGFEKSGIALRRALELDPEFAPAHLAMAARYLTLTGSALAAARESMPICRDHALNALRLDPSLSEAHAILGVIAATHDYDWDAAAAQFRLAIAGRPVPGARFRYAVYYLLPMRRFDEALAQIDEALRDDPLNLLQRSNLAICLAAAGRQAESERCLRDVLEVDSNFWIALLVSAANAAAASDLDAARATAERAHECSHRNARTMGLLAGLLSLEGRSRRVDELLDLLSDDDADVATTGLMDYHLVRNEIDEAAEWAHMAIARRDPMLPVVLQHPYARPLRHSPRWASLAVAMRLSAS